MKSLKIIQLNSIGMKMFFKITILSIFLLSIVSAIHIKSAGALEINHNIKFLADSASNTMVAPLAKFKKIAATRFKQMHMTKNQWLSKFPTQSELGVLVYPGAKIVDYQPGYKDETEKTLPELILVSTDPPGKIESWYLKKLKGWQFKKGSHVFLPANKDVNVMSDKFDATPHIMIEKIFRKGQLDGMFLKQPDNAKTGIIIRY